MALRTIVLDGDPRLTKECREVTDFDEKLHQLLDDMDETMRNAQGVGLAAPQVGILRRAVIVDVGDGLIELINPVIIYSEGEQESEEGCLSFPGKVAITIRPELVRVKAQDRNGKEFEIEGRYLKAKAFCHEIDHLDGISFLQRAVRVTDSKLNSINNGVKSMTEKIEKRITERFKK
jgi:peptide deformylase